MLASLDQVTRLGFVNLAEERTRVQKYVERLQIRTPSLDQRMINLSGGNQQKVVISKWLMLQPKILIMDEPTRGIDVGAKQRSNARTSDAISDPEAGGGEAVVSLWHTTNNACTRHG
jgi:ABC-type sugar transport system ATPase subunit